jgi:hypothetical protein
LKRTDLNANSLYPEIKQPLPTSPTPSRCPALLKLRLGLLLGRHAVRSCHWTVGIHRPEPPQTVGAAACLVDAADLPLTSEDRVVRAILVDPGAEAGWAHGERHRSSTPPVQFLEIIDKIHGGKFYRVLLLEPRQSSTDIISVRGPSQKIARCRTQYTEGHHDFLRRLHEE